MGVGGGGRSETLQSGEALHLRDLAPGPFEKTPDQVSVDGLSCQAPQSGNRGTRRDLEAPGRDETCPRRGGSASEDNSRTINRRTE